MSEARAIAGGLKALFSKPRKLYENVDSGTVYISSTPAEMVYIRACSNCELWGTTKLAKCIMESCSSVKVAFQEPIMSGTLELIDCQNVSIFINPRDTLPTVSAERCQTLHLHYIQPKALGSVYTVQCSDVTVHFKPPHKEEYVLELPGGGGGSDQFVSSLSGEDMVTEKVIREGVGHATTATKQAEAERREKELMRRYEEHLLKMFKIGPSSTSPSPSNTGSSQPSTEVPSSTQEEKEVEKEEMAEKEVEGEEEEGEEEEEEEEKEDTPLATALREKRQGLKPTETVERRHPVVGTGGGERGGKRGRGFNPAIDDEEEKKEFFDSPEQLSHKVEQTLQWVKSSGHIIVFTGAGISTSCGIPDFRSGMNTVLETGPGVWELRAHNTAPQKASRTVPLIRALPSPTHMSIVKLHEKGIVKFTVSQNVDGLHRRSGLAPAELSELHGNTNLETCRRCGRQYLRDFETREAFDVYDHTTSRRCDDPDCQGDLDDSIINFGESLPQGELKKAFTHAGQADLCIVLGSSLRVSPANQVPEIVLAQGGRVVLCNLQKIPHLPVSNKILPVFSKCDQFMQALMEHLGYKIPEFVLHRRVQVSLEERGVEGGGNIVVTTTGLDVEENVPYSFIKAVSIESNEKTYSASDEPLTLSLPAPPSSTPLLLTLSFHGHYGEPPLQLHYPMTPGGRVYSLHYHISQGVWQVEEAK